MTEKEKHLLLSLKKPYRYENLKLHSKNVVKVFKQLKKKEINYCKSFLQGLVYKNISIKNKFYNNVAIYVYRILDQITSSINNKFKDNKGIILSELIVNKGIRKGISGRPAAFGSAKPIYLDTCTIIIKPSVIMPVKSQK